MKYILSALLLTTLLFSCTDMDKKLGIKGTKTYQENKTGMEDKEKESPKEFLQLSGDDHRNFWGRTVYRGLIKNTATIVSYNNIRVKLFYFKAGQQVANHEELLDKAIAPNDYCTFRAKYKTPKGTDSVVAYIIDAKVAE